MIMQKFNLTHQMKEYLRQKMVMTDFEMLLHLRDRRRQLITTIAGYEAEIKGIEVKLEALTQPDTALVEREKYRKEDNIL